jgi:hypothetical protein
MTADSKTTRALLSEPIDYAGLFSSAGPNMAAVRQYASYLAGEYSWMPGRFVVQAGRLAELEKAGSRYFGGRKSRDDLGARCPREIAIAAERNPKRSGVVREGRAAACACLSISEITPIFALPSFTPRM